MLWWTLRKLQSDSWQVRADAVAALAKSRKLSAVDPLLALLQKEEHFDVRLAIVDAFGQIKDRRAVGPLLVTLTCSFGLSKFHTAVIGSLEAIDPDWRVHEMARDTAAKLMLRLRDDAVNVPPEAATLLAAMGHVAAIEPLRAMLNDKYADRSPFAWLDVSRSLEQLDPTWRNSRARMQAIQVAVRALLGIIGYEPLNRKASAVRALGQIGDRSTMNRLIQLRTDLQERIAAAEPKVRAAELFGGRAFTGVGVADKIASLASKNIEEQAASVRNQLGEDKTLLPTVEEAIEEIRKSVEEESQDSLP